MERRRFSFGGGLNRIREGIGTVFQRESTQKPFLGDQIEMAVDTKLGPLVVSFNLKEMRDFFKEVVEGIAKESGTAKKDCDNIDCAINGLGLRIGRESFFPGSLPGVFSVDGQLAADPEKSNFVLNFFPTSIERILGELMKSANLNNSDLRGEQKELILRLLEGFLNFSLVHEARHLAQLMGFGSRPDLIEERKKVHARFNKVFATLSLLLTILNFNVISKYLDQRLSLFYLSMMIFADLLYIYIRTGYYNKMITKIDPTEKDAYDFQKSWQAQRRKIPEVIKIRKIEE